MSALNVVAEFGQVAQARDAMIALEQQGVDANDISLIDRVLAVPPGEATRTADLATGRNFFKRFGIGAVIGAVVGAVLFSAIVAVIGPEPTGPLLVFGLVAGAIVGFYLGGFANLARKLPVNVDAIDTFGSQAVDQTGPFRVAVYVVDASRADQVAKVLERLDPVSVRREEVEGRHVQ